MRSISDHIDELFGRPPEHGISLAMVVLVDGEVVAERYGVAPANPLEPERRVDAETPLISWSMAKSMTHAAVGLLVADGLLDLEAPAPVAAWRGTEKAAIRTLDLLEMRPGLSFVEDYVDGETSDCIAMLFGAGADDHARYARDLPLIHPPGTVWNYSSGTTNIICSIIGDIVSGHSDAPTTRQAAVTEWLAGRLFGPLGMTSANPGFDPAGNWVGSSYVHATALDFARFGEMYRNDGIAQSGPATGSRILPIGWVDHARHVVAHDPASDEFADRFPGGADYGRHWWMWPHFEQSLVASGYEGQMIVVVPDRRLTLVHLGKTPAEVRQHLVGAVIDLIDDAVPVASPT